MGPESFSATAQNKFILAPPVHPAREIRAGRGFFWARATLQETWCPHRRADSSGLPAGQGEAGSPDRGSLSCSNESFPLCPIGRLRSWGCCKKRELDQDLALREPRLSQPPEKQQLLEGLGGQGQGSTPQASMSCKGLRPCSSLLLLFSA